MIEQVVITLEEGTFVFTMPLADGVMQVDGIDCFAEGYLNGPHRYFVSNRPLKEAAQWWIAERQHLVAARGIAEKRVVPFMEKENFNVSS